MDRLVLVQNFNNMNALGGTHNFGHFFTITQARMLNADWSIFTIDCNFEKISSSVTTHNMAFV
jgi:hypothetical protein